VPYLHQPLHAAVVFYVKLCRGAAEILLKEGIGRVKSGGALFTAAAERQIEDGNFARIVPKGANKSRFDRIGRQSAVIGETCLRGTSRRTRENCRAAKGQEKQLEPAGTSHGLSS